MDFGLHIMHKLHEKMLVDEEWTAWRPRGFSWWPGGLAQHVEVSEPFEHGGTGICWVTIRTDVAHQFPDTQRAREMLGALLGFSTIAGYRLHDSRLELVTSVVVHLETLEMWEYLLPLVAPLQATEAYKAVELFLGIDDLIRDGFIPAASSHPERGFREDHDEILSYTANVFVPIGEEASRFLGQFAAAARAADGEYSILTNADESGMAAEVPFGDFTALLQMRAGRHPRLGNGMIATLQLPLQLSAGPALTLALQLNGHEPESDPWRKTIGSWCVSPSGDLSYVSFLPNICALPGLPIAWGQYMAYHALWAHGLTASSFQQSKRSARSSLDRLFGHFRS